MHAYPAQLADFVLDHWPAALPLELKRRAFSELLSTCFQASLAHEEGRNVRFRLVSGSAEEVTRASANSDFLCLEFSEPQPFTPEAARRLSPAAPFHSSLIGVTANGDEWTMWGIVHTGANWLAPTWGGRRNRQEGLPLPTVHVLGAGRVGVYAGAELVASLEHGMIEATTTDVFGSNWLGKLFGGTRNKEADLQATRVGGRANPELVRVVSQHMVRRAIFLIRQAGHGGLLLFAESELLEECRNSVSNAPLKLKYTFRNNTARFRYRTLLERLFDVLAKHSQGEVDLQSFLSAETPDVISVEQSIFELSRLVSGLAAVDGAVVLNKRFELIGFGAEVSGELPYPDTVQQALDVEGERRSPEPANSVGTRHRAAYRFVNAHPEGLAVVISMDGIVRFVANIEGTIVYWDQFLNW
ncbi:MAG: putative sensor domain DACNV-containing protein [Polyangiaceae bacterium]